MATIYYDASGNIVGVRTGEDASWPVDPSQVGHINVATTDPIYFACRDAPADYHVVDGAVVARD